MSRIMGRWLFACVLALSPAFPLAAAELLLTIVHTNDMHSHLQGFAPEGDFTPLVPGDDRTLGGWARIASVIRGVRENRKNPVIALDAGDFLMGSLFHLVSREEAVELRLMKAMGYDAVGLGNHEFDLMPDGLARILATANARGGLPRMLFSSAVFDPANPKDDALEQAFKDGLVIPYAVVDAGGIRIGLFAVIGENAAEAAPFASPVRFRPAAEAAKEMVSLLREKERVDLVVCLSHSGLSDNPKKSEDELLAARVPGIDVIISGHTHTNLARPIVVNGTIIVQAWAYGRQAGVLDLGIDAGKVALKSWRPVPVDDSAAGDWLIQGAIEAAVGIVDEQVLEPLGLSYRQIIAETDRDLPLPEAESGLGNLAADAIRWYVNEAAADPADPASRVVLVVESGGMLRDEIRKGTSGRISVADLFRVLPLGVGMDGTMAYPLITVWLTGAEIKKALEVITSIHPRKGIDYFLHVSGVKFTWNPRRMFFDRVTGVWLGGEEEGWAPLDYSRQNPALYRVAANIYNATFLKIVGDFTYHALDIVPKDRYGKPITDLASARVDADPAAPGVQELKSWVGLMEYVRLFPDTDGNGVPNVPAKYLGPLGRQANQPSWNPVSLVSRATAPTLIAAGVAVVVLAIVGLVVVLGARLVRRLSRRRRA